MKRRAAFTFATLSLSVLCVVPAQAQLSTVAQNLRDGAAVRSDSDWRRPDDRRYDDRRGSRERLLRELDLTRAQERRIENILDKAGRDEARLRDRLHDRERTYAELQRRGDRRARTVQTDIRRLRERIADNRRDTRIRIESVLTPRQRQHLARYERNGHRDRYDRRDDRRGGHWLDLLDDASWGR